MLFTHLSIAVTIPNPFYTSKTPTNPASEGAQARHLCRPRPEPPGPLRLPRSALRASHARFPQGSSLTAPGWPQPILPPNSISLFHSPSPSSPPRPTRTGRPRGRGRAAGAGPDSQGPRLPAPGREAAPAAGTLSALGSPQPSRGRETRAMGAGAYSPGAGGAW